MLHERFPVMTGNHFRPEARGYGVVYRENEINHCPGCGRTHWYIGRLTAECAFCATAVPLPDVTLKTSATVRHKKRRT